MPDTPTLFDAPATAGSVRAADPQTSADAARRVDARRRCAEVLRALTALLTEGPPPGAPDHGATCYEVTRRLRLNGVDTEQNIVARRLKDLEEHADVSRTGHTRPGRTGRHQVLWTTATQGASQP